GAALVGDVARDALDVRRRPVRAVHGAEAADQHALLAVGPAHAELDVLLAAAGQRRRPRVLDGGAVGGLDVLHERAEAHGPDGRVEPEDAVQLGRPAGLVGRGVPGPGAD